MNKTRLLTISDMIIKGENVADIGTDHAVLPLYLMENNLVPGIIATDIAFSPFTRAQLALAELQGQVQVRLGDGLKVLDFAEVSTVVIAGMGGDTIVEILAEDWAKAYSFKRFVFQPMTRANVLRRVLADKGWPIQQECVVQEKGKFYIVMSASPANTPYQLKLVEMDIGPFILRQNDETTGIYLDFWLKKYERIYHSLHNSTEINGDMLIELRGKIQMLREIINDGKSKGYYRNNGKTLST